jgi:Protein of unknown function (DUF1573)
MPICKRMLGTTLLGVAVALAAWGLAAMAPPQAPYIDLPAVIDLGLQEKGGRVEAPLVIRNRGKQPLVLENFGTTCGCVTPFRQEDGARVNVSREVVPPRSELEILVDASVRSDKGEFRHGVWFDTNDPRRPHVEVALTGTVDIGVYTLPSQLQLGRLTPGQTFEGAVRVVDCRRRGPRQPLQVKCSSSAIRVESLCPTGRAEDRSGIDATDDVYILRLSVTAPKAGCNIYDDLLLQDESGNVFAAVPVAGSVAPVLSLSPSSIFLANDTSAGSQVVQRRCMCWCPQGVLSLSVARSLPGLSVSLSKSTNPNIRFIEVKCPANKLPFRGTKSLLLSATCGDGHSERLELPITIASLAQK